jgi:hypothetical protein
MIGLAGRNRERTGHTGAMHQSAVSPAADDPAARSIPGAQQVPGAVPDPWPAPRADGPVLATVGLPGSKSVTNRALVLGALADGPSTVRRPLHARDTELMATAPTSTWASPGR